MSSSSVSSKKFSISEVIDSFGINRFTWFIFAFLGFAMIFDGYDYMVVSYTMSKIQAEWGLSTLMTGSLTSWSIIGIVIGAAISGIVSDRVGRKNTLVISIAVYSLLTVPIYFVNSFAVFAFFRVASGLGLGACIPVVTTLISETVPTKRRSIFISLALAWMIVGWVIAGLIAEVVVPVLGWRFCYLIGGIPFIYAIILYFVMPESVYWLVNRGRRDEAVKMLKRVEKIATGKVTEWDHNGIVAPPREKVSGPAALFSKNYSRVTIGIWLCYFTGSFVLYGINAWLPKITADLGFAYIAIASNAVAVVANVLTGFIAEKIGRKKNLILSFVLTGIAVLFLSTALKSITAGILLGASLFVGFTMNYTLCSLNPLMAEAYPTGFRNTGVSWGQAVGRIGAIIAPIIAGVIMSLYPDKSNMSVIYSSAFLFFIIPAVVGVLGVIFFIKKETRGISLDQLVEITTQ